MKDQLKWVLNHMPKSDDQHLDVMSLPNVAKARSFHGSFPQYSITPLAQLDGMAQYLGLAGVYVKDESYRFGLNAFKVLGGSFAMARYIAGEMGRDVSEMNYDYLTSEAFRKEFGQATFFTATDGNHGRGVAWAANKLGQKSVVHMPKGSSKSRFDNIAKEGAKVTIEESTTMTVCVWLPRKPHRRNTASSCRIPPGTATRRSPPGSCRATAPWPTRPPTSFVSAA